MIDICILMSSVAVPFALQAHHLIGRDYLISAGEIAAVNLVGDFLIISRRNRQRFCLSAASLGFSFAENCTLASTGFSSASLALAGHTQVHGNTWNNGEAFLIFVLPAMTAVLSVFSSRVLPWHTPYSV